MAPPDSPFYPFIIPPLQHVHDGHKYTCIGDGLLLDGWAFDKDAHKYIAFPKKHLIELEFHKEGEKPVFQEDEQDHEEVEKKPKKYWKAQCVFRGLKSTGTIAVMQEAIMEHFRTHWVVRDLKGDPRFDMIPQIRAEEDRSNREFRKRIALATKEGHGNIWAEEKEASEQAGISMGVQVRKPTWEDANTDEEKAELDFERFLKEKFPRKKAKSTKSGKAVVVIVRQTQISATSNEVLEGLALDYIDDIPDPTGHRKVGDPWAIIAPSKQAVIRKRLEIEQETDEALERLREDAQEEARRSPNLSGDDKVRQDSERPLTGRSRPTKMRTPDPPLDPVVIDFLIHKYNGITYTSVGRGFRLLGWSFDKDVEQSLPREPLVELSFNNGKAKDKAQGKVSPEKASVGEKPKTRPWNYWRAQCIFRGLEAHGKISKMQEAIRATNCCGMDPGTAAEEERVNTEFRRQNAIVRESGIKEEAAINVPEADFGQLLKMVFPTKKGGEGRTGDAIVINLPRKRSDSLAGEAHLSFDMVNKIMEPEAPTDDSGHQVFGHDWYIIAPNKGALTDKRKEIKKTTDESRAEKRWEYEEEMKEMHENVVQESKHGSASGTEEWDVTGTWAISCPGGEDFSPTGQSECKMDIHIGEKDNGDYQMWATFNFFATRGVMRFVKPAPSTSSAKSSSKKRKREEFEDKADFEMKSNNEKPRYRESDFLIPREINPSPALPVWQYRWRGDDTGICEIQEGSDKITCPIMFLGPSGTEMKGFFHCPGFFSSPFTGRKIAMEPGNVYYAAATAKREWDMWKEDQWEAVEPSDIDFKRLAGFTGVGSGGPAVMLKL